MMILAKVEAKFKEMLESVETKNSVSHETSSENSTDEYLFVYIND